MRRLMSSISLIAVILGATAANTAQAKLVPLQSDICLNGVVDKKKLVNFLLDAYGVRRDFQDSLPPDATHRYDNMPSWQQLFVDERLQPPCPECSAEFRKMYKKDLDAVGAATQGLISILRDDRDSYQNLTGTIEPSEYLTDPKAQLECRTRDGTPIEAPGAEESK